MTPAARRQLVMELVGDLTDEQIAERLGVSLRTVKLDKEHMRRELGAATTVDAVRRYERTRGRRPARRVPEPTEPLW